jgi:hypothetical protein
MTTFNIELEYSLDVQLDRDEYFGGQTASVSFTTMWGTEEVANNSVFYIIYTNAGNLTVGNTSSGEASFEVPLEFVGWMYVEAVTIINGYFLDGWAQAWVQKAYIALVPAVEIYSGGDAVLWNFEILTMMTSGLLSYEIEDDAGNPVAATSMTFATSGTISYTVPTDDPSGSYTITVTLKDGLGNNVDASSTMWLQEEYTITVWLESDSGFVSRAFEPGDEVDFGYAITTNGATHRSVYEITFYTSVDYIEMSVLTTSQSGTLTVTVPGDATDGAYAIVVTLRDGVSGSWLSGDDVQFDLMTDQSGWSKEIAGMSAIDFTILVLIIVMIVLLIVVPFLKGRSGPILKPKAKHEQAPMPMIEQPPAPPQ